MFGCGRKRGENCFELSGTRIEVQSVILWMRATDAHCGRQLRAAGRTAVKENHSHIRYLEALLAIECEERDRHAIDSRIRDAQLPRLKRSKSSTLRKRRRFR